MASELGPWAYQEADVRQRALNDQTQDRGDLRGLADPSVSSDTLHCLPLQLCCPSLQLCSMPLPPRFYELSLPSLPSCLAS